MKKISWGLLFPIILAGFGLPNLVLAKPDGEPPCPLEKLTEGTVRVPDTRQRVRIFVLDNAVDGPKKGTKRAIVKVENAADRARVIGELKKKGIDVLDEGFGTRLLVAVKPKDAPKITTIKGVDTVSPEIMTATAGR